MQTSLLELFLSKHSELIDIERDTLYYKDFKNSEMELIKNLTEKQEKLYKEVKHFFEEHLYEIYFKYMKKLLSFGISVGIELQQDWDEEDI